MLHLSWNKFNTRFPRLRQIFDEKLWRALLGRMAAVGMNMVVIDLGDAVKYRSHPEIAVEGAWTPARLKRELKRIRGLGLEPIPKLNFSACHDLWLGPYERQLSTEAYYRVCRDLIREVGELFHQPRLFHLGMDEETANKQRHLEYIVVRQHDLWWHDLKFLADQVGAAGSRAWIWSDYIWGHAEEFARKMPKRILQSNWYYGTSFSRKIGFVQAYDQLEALGYDQVPTVSNCDCDENMAKTVRFCRKHISPRRLLGFLQTPWRPTTRKWHAHNLRSIDLAGQAKASLRGV